MKLLYSATSPYVRKVLAAAIELGLADQMTLEPVVVAPTAVNEVVSARNPLVKVPTLITDDGEALYDSRVIAAYLDSLSGGRLIPEGTDRFAVLRREATADGLLDAAILSRYEVALRPEPLRWADWIQGQQRKILNALDRLEQEAAALETGLGPVARLDSIAVAAALGYLDFRFDTLGWRQGRPGLTRFDAAAQARPALARTRPPA